MAYKFGNESHLLPNLYARAQRFRAIRGVPVKRKKSKSQKRKWTPMLTAFTLEGKLIEGEGIAPDIEVPFDVDLYEATGQDSQLDRALRYIRTGQ